MISLLLLLIPHFSYAEPREQLNLVMGLQTVIDLRTRPCPNVMECLRSGNRSLLEIQYSQDKNQLILTPIARGETTIIVRDEHGDVATTYDVIVSPYNLKRYAEELKELLRELTTVSITIRGDHIVVDGQVSEYHALQRAQVVFARPGMKEIADNLVTLTKAGMEKAAHDIEEQLGKPGLKVKPWNGVFLLEGHSKDQNEARSALELARKLAAALGISKPVSGELVISKLPGD